MNVSISTSNYFDVISQKGLPNNPTLASSHEQMALVSADNWAAYREDSDIRDVVDLYFQKLEDYYGGGKKKEAEPAAPQPAAKKPEPKVAQPKKAAKPKAQKTAPKTTPEPPKKAAPKAKADPAPKGKPGGKSSGGAAASSKPAAAKTPAAPTGGGVFKLSSSVRHIQRVLGLANKPVPVTRVNALLRSLQNAITEKEITERDVHADVIKPIQQLLVQVVNTASKDSVHIEVGGDMLAKLAQKAGGEHVYSSVPVIKAFTRFSGKQPTAKQLESLIKRAQVAQKNDEDPYQAVLKDIIALCEKASKKGSVVFDSRGLSGTQNNAFKGIAGISDSLNKYSRHAAVYAKQATRTAAKKTAAAAGRSLLRASGHTHSKGSCGCAGAGVSGVKKKPCGCTKKTPAASSGIANLPRLTARPGRGPLQVFDKPCVTKLSGGNRKGIMSSTELMRKEFDVVELWGKWRTLIGKPERGFKVMVWGKPGQGKSTASIDFARYLAEHIGPSLYIAAEEPGSMTLQDKLTRTGGSVKGLDFAGEIPSMRELEHYDHVFIDSVNTLRLPQEDFRKLVKDHPHTAFILIFQATKEGNFKGNQEWEHDVDVVVQVDAGQAKTLKNRFGALSQITIF